MKYIPYGTSRLEEIEILLGAGLYWLRADPDEDPDDPRDPKATAEECFAEAYEYVIYMLKQQKQNEDNAKQNIT